MTALDDNSRWILSDALAMYAREHRMAAAQRQAIEFALDRLTAAPQAAQTQPVTDELLVRLFYAAQANITQFRIKAREILSS